MIHGLNDLLRFIGTPADIKDEFGLIEENRYADYTTYFQDKQNILAYQDERLKRKFLPFSSLRSWRKSENREVYDDVIVHSVAMYLPM